MISALLARDWRIVHISGHGEPPSEDGNPRGVVLSHDNFLGPREIRSMRTVPELVFVNCCYLAARNATELLTPDGARQAGAYNRAQFAASVAEELIKIGVRCVVAAGWAVSDDAASAFAQPYDALLTAGGSSMVVVARRAPRREHPASGATIRTTPP